MQWAGLLVSGLQSVPNLDGQFFKKRGGGKKTFRNIFDVANFRCNSLSMGDSVHVCVPGKSKIIRPGSGSGL